MQNESLDRLIAHVPTSMHYALGILEILYNIFGHLAPDQDWSWSYDQLPGIRTLAKLARTCRTFKEPALDVLWSELPDLSALARCVPDAVQSKKRWHYAFKRPLTKAEWGTIQSYARRVRTFHDCKLGSACLEDESIMMLFSNTDGTLFPSLRSLSWGYEKSFHLSHIAATQSLKILHLDFRCGDISDYRNILDSVGNLCPLMEIFRLRLSRQYLELDTVMSNQVLRWSSLRILECSDVALNAGAILHISRVAMLTRLSFVLSEETPGQVLTPDLPLIFPYLTRCDIASGGLLPVAHLFSRTKFPAITELTVKIPGSSSGQTIWSFMRSLENACSSNSLTHLSVLSQRSLLRRLPTRGNFGLNNCPITYHDLYPCAALGNLRSLRLDFDQPIHLTDHDLIELGTAWPHLEDLIINNDAGWCSAGGLTLHGLVQLLRTCPSLRNFCILLNTATFAYIPEGVNVSYPERQLGCVNLVESPLEADIFDRVVDVFVALKFSPRLLIAWRHVETEQRRVVGVPYRSWQELDDMVKARIATTSETKDELIG